MTGKAGKVFVLFIIPLILYIGLLPVMPLMEPDEGRYSSIPSYMNKSGDYVTPRLKEVVYIEKPPLAYWATALAFKIFGENEFSSRLFAGLCAWGCILLVYAMGKFLFDFKTGLYGAAVLTTSLFHFVIGRLNILDMPVAFFLSLATWAGYRYFSCTANRGWLYFFYFTSALAFLAKGLIGVVFPLAIISIWLLSVRRWREVFKLLSPQGIILFLVVSLPWIILIQKAHSDFFRFFFIQEHFLRYTTTIHQRNEPFYFYVPYIILGTLPWFFFLFKAMKKKSATRFASFFFERGRGYGCGQETEGERLFRKNETNFLLTWIGFITIFFSLSSSKLIPYMAPVFLPLSLFMGRIFCRYDGQKNDTSEDRILSWTNVPVIFQSLLFISFMIFVPYFKKDFSVTHWWAWIFLPVFLQVALIFLPHYLSKKGDEKWFLTVYIIVTFFLATMLFPLSQFLTPYKSAYPLAQAIKKYVPVGHDLYQYDMSLYGIDFYDKIRTPIVGDIGEVLYGSKFLPTAERARYFLNNDEFSLLIKKGLEIYCATKGPERVERLRKIVSPVTILWDNKYYYLMRLGNPPSKGKI